MEEVVSQRVPKPARTGVNLSERWTTDWQDLGTPPPAVTLRDALLQRYAEPHRAYHTARHLEECFTQLERSRDLAEHSGEVAIAVWFHDAVYDTHASDNEIRSAALAVDAVARAGGGRELADRVGQLVLATRHDAEPAPGDATLLVDIDLAILGAIEARFDEYERQIRLEYVWVPEQVYRARRAEILRGFLARPRIYGTARFRGWYEAPARANLERSIARLGG